MMRREEVILKSHGEFQGKNIVNFASVIRELLSVVDKSSTWLEDYNM